MTADILFSWNVLYSTLIIWLAIVSVALTVDFGPEIYRERFPAKFPGGSKVINVDLDSEAIAQYRQVKREELIPVFIITKPEPVQKRRHARA